MIGDDPLVAPKTWEQALDILLAEMRALMVNRHRKYGAANIARHGEAGIIVRVGDKIARLEHAYVTQDGTIKGHVYDGNFGDETVDDAWLDLANYAGPIRGMIKRGWWGLPADCLQRNISGDQVPNDC